MSVDDLRRQISQAQTRHNLFPSGSPQQPMPVVVGVSGGADSICLLHLLCSVADRWHIHLHVAHLDHNLRPESAADARFVAELAAAWQLPLHSQQLAAASLSGNSEDAARRARYRFLCSVAYAVTPPGSSPTVAVAHHADDQAETVLLHLLRGSGLDGLGGMRLVTLYRDSSQPEAATVRIVRPLLSISRSQIQAHLRRHDLTWREDLTNQETTFLRNRLRHQVMPALSALNPDLVTSLGRTAQLLAEEARRATRIDEDSLRRLRVSGETLAQPGDHAPQLLDLTLLRALDLAGQRGVLRRALANLGPATDAIGFNQIEGLVWHLRRTRRSGGPYPLAAGLAYTVVMTGRWGPAQVSLHRSDQPPFAANHPCLPLTWQTLLPAEGLLPIPSGWSLQSRLLDRTALPADWRHNPQPWQAFLDADRVQQPLLTTPRPGLRLQPLGMSAGHKSVGDLFTDAKVPVPLRPTWPLILDTATDRTVWLCGIQIDHRARITPQTRQVLWLCWRRPVELPHPPPELL